MKIEIDFELCQGHAVCMGEAPEVFRVSEEGEVEILQDAPPASLRSKLEAAARFCPTGSIRVVERGDHGAVVQRNR